MLFEPLRMNPRSVKRFTDALIVLGGMSSMLAIDVSVPVNVPPFCRSASSNSPSDFARGLASGFFGSSTL